ncbi:MAG: amidohydrolase [Candidatus Korobacteraceae bacterium]
MKQQSTNSLGAPAPPSGSPGTPHAAFLSAGMARSIAAHFPEAVEWRRQLHRNPQPAWLEFYSTGLVAEKLSSWGYKVSLGKQIIAADKRQVVPDAQTLEAEYQRALRAGIKEEFIAPARGGFTGVVGELAGGQPGPTVAFRFDIDSLEILESSDPAHPPAAGGYASQNKGYAHMCGHDAHTALGLLLARCLAENRANIGGTVKFIFQPNEENLGGAVTMVPMGVVDGVDYLFGCHVGITIKETGKIGLNVFDWLAMNRFEVTYTGRAAHAAVRPDLGRNALLGACAAVTNLYAISRHGTGASRVNVGVMQAGTTWNIIPEKAYFRMETRGVSNEINEYMVGRAMDVLHGAAKMHDLELQVVPATSTVAALNSPELIELGTTVARSLPSVKEVVPACSTNGSEDMCLLMQTVQQRGGKALEVLLGTPIGGGHHSNCFDVDEKVMQNGAEFFAAMHAAVTGQK